MTQTSSAPGLPRVLYLARGTPQLYDNVRTYAPPNVQLVTLDSDDPQELFAKLAESEVVIVATRKFTGEMIAAAKRLRLVVHQGVGYHDTMDVAALRARAIPVAVTPNGTAQTVSEHAVMLMLAACRLLPFADAELRQGRFHVNALRLQSQTLAGKTVGFIGMGRIGQATAGRLLGWEMNALYVDPVPLPDAEAARLNVTRVQLPQLLERADIVSLHVPLTSETRALIDAAAIAGMKRGAVLVNTARGPVVDQRALVDALRSGQLGAAALDVFEEEPVAAGHPLAEFRNVVLTPHIAAATRDTFAAKMQGVFANIARFYAATPLQDQVL
jgi:phosphoglycerate dehydrogenase-like enzyme